MGLRDRLRRTDSEPGPDLDDLEARVVWMLGSPRTGTTWLINLLMQQPGFVMSDEPGIGVHLGLFSHEFFGAPARTYDAGPSTMTRLRADDPQYFFATEYEDAWRPALRTLILTRFAAQMQRVGKPDATLLVKEPNGTQGADVLLAAMPRSQVLWLLRDGRDVVDSLLDGIRPGGWISEYGSAPWEMTDDERLRFVEDAAHVWLRRSERMQELFAQLPERQRLLVRYEDLRADTVPHLRPVLAWLGREVDAGELAAVSDRLSFEKLPAEQRGQGKFARAAKPGGWRENLGAREQAVMEQVMGAKLRELGYVA